jgi:hypothetical protein
MVFLIMVRHSLTPCMPRTHQMDPLRYIESQTETLLRGLCARPEEATP